ncbi:AAA family ATPase [Tolypothrix sp. PCC 7910]|uniref:AAA family ATPase n=1 Tax=Tolypothrix sp. PCC 7910 TaxID=2099387 RepID=UPI0014278CD9|nr:AAA family ATPase [Tolypothrix sp. PCC 7910]QIR39857.1 AAA family ATPase [Tolypothrix sp. PCC 7910]
MGKSLSNTNWMKANGGQPLILEFVGLPGAGKTTVCREVASRLKNQGLSLIGGDEILQQWKQQNTWQKLIKLIPQTQNQWQILLYSLFLASQVKPTNKQSFSKAAKIFANVKRLDAIARSAAPRAIAHHQDSQIILLDQGLLQEIWSVGITGTTPSGENIKQELALLFNQRPMAIAYFQIDVDTALERIQNRPTAESRFDRMHPEAAQQLLSKYVAYMQEIVNCAQTFSIPILEIDSSLPIDEKTQSILSWMNNDFMAHSEPVFVNNII